MAPLVQPVAVGYSVQPRDSLGGFLSDAPKTFVAPPAIPTKAAQRSDVPGEFYRAFTGVNLVYTPPSADEKFGHLTNYTRGPQGAELGNQDSVMLRIISAMMANPQAELTLVYPYDPKKVSSEDAQKRVEDIKASFVALTGYSENAQPLDEPLQKEIARIAGLRDVTPDEFKVVLLPRAGTNPQATPINFVVYDKRTGAKRTFISEPPPSVLQSQSTSVSPVSFSEPFNAAAVQPDPLFFAAGANSPLNSQALNDLVDALKQDPSQCVRLTGHTDNIGLPDNNLELGWKRAIAIQTALIERGVNPDQIAIDSQGARQPMASNQTPTGRAKNRRVAVEFFRPEPGPDAGLEEEFGTLPGALAYFSQQPPKFSQR